MVKESFHRMDKRHRAATTTWCIKTHNGCAYRLVTVQLRRRIASAGTGTTKERTGRIRVEVWRVSVLQKMSLIHTCLEHYKSAHNDNTQQRDDDWTRSTRRCSHQRSQLQR